MGKSRLVAAAFCIQHCILAAIVAVGIGGGHVSASSAQIFNTGVDNNGALLPLGSVDPHYTLVSSAEPDNPGPNAYTASLADTWLPDGPNSRWITPLPATKLMGVGDYDYRTTFDLTGLNPASVQLQGQWTTDNAGQAILLNGSHVGAGSIVAAGTLLVEGQKVPPRSLVMGSPGKVRRLLTQAEVADIQLYADRYVGYRLEYMKI